jgi:hypothetical protein
LCRGPMAQMAAGWMMGAVVGLEALARARVPAAVAATAGVSRHLTTATAAVMAAAAPVAGRVVVIRVEEGAALAVVAAAVGHGTALSSSRPLAGLILLCWCLS